MTRPCAHRTINLASDGTATCTRCVRSTNIGVTAGSKFTLRTVRRGELRPGTKRAIAAMFAFNLVVEDALIACGAKRSTYDRKHLYTSYAWTLDTPLGPLGITPNGNYIVCRFARDYAALAAPGNRGSPYSNKWNSHYDLGYIEGAYEFIWLLDELLAMQLGPEPDALDKALARIGEAYPSRFATGTLPR
jgi:hypothetical protein